MKAKSGTNGNNVISLQEGGSDKLLIFPGGKERTRSNAGHQTNDGYNSFSRRIFLGKNSSGIDMESNENYSLPNVSGNLAYVLTKEDAATTIHETFHLFGLGDRYIENKVKYYYTSMINGKEVIKEYKLSTFHAGFNDDLMNNKSLKTFNQTHINNLANAALKKQATSSGTSFVLGQEVDNANSSQTQNADPNPYPNYTLTPPNPKKR